MGAGRTRMSDAPVYNDAIVKKFVIATVFWGVVAF